MSAELVTGFSTNEDGRQLVILDLTDEMIADLKRNGAALQTAERNGHNVDIVIRYAPSLNMLVSKLKEATPNVEVRMI